MKQLCDSLYYVGVNDRHKALFEGLWPLPAGVSYNSYLLVDQQVALVDTVDAAFFPQFLAHIREILGARPIDYLIINHMEPDHSGSIDLIRTYYPDLTIVGNKKTLEMVTGYYGPAPKTLIVADGDKLSLGTHELTFALIPMVHWPETMVTFDSATGTLFSGDAFGCYGALDGGVTDRQLDVHAFWGEMRRYYANIVGKYGVPVQRAIQKLKGLDLRRLCPTHGPVWEEQLQRVVETYDRLSRYEAEPGLVVAYGSMYGNTEAMAEAVAQGAVEAGLRRVVVRDCSEISLSQLLADVFRYRGLVVGSPTYNGALHPAVEALLTAIAARDVKGRLYGVMGSFTWASAAVKALVAWGEARGFEQVAAPIDNKQGCDLDTLAACRQLGAEMARRLLEA